MNLFIRFELAQQQPHGLALFTHQIQNNKKQMHAARRRCRVRKDVQTKNLAMIAGKKSTALVKMLYAQSCVVAVPPALIRAKKNVESLRESSLQQEGPNRQRVVVSILVL